MANADRPAPGGPEGTTGRASEALTGLAAAGGRADTTGAMVDNTSAGAATTTSTSARASKGPNLGVGSGQAGGLGLHGDPDVGAQAGSTGMMGGAAGSGAAADNERNLTSGLAGAAGHQEGTEAGGPAAVRPAGMDKAATPGAEVGDTTTSIGGSEIDRVTASRGSDVGSGPTGTG